MSSVNVYSPANKRKSVADDLAKLDLWPKDERTIVKDGVLSINKSKNDWKSYYCCIKGATFSIYKNKGDEIAYRVVPLKDATIGPIFSHEKLPLYCTSIKMAKSDYAIGLEHQEGLKEWIIQFEIAGARIEVQQAIPVTRSAGDASTTSPLSTSPVADSKKPKRRLSFTPVKRRNSSSGSRVAPSPTDSPQESRSSSPLRSNSPTKSLQSASAPILAAVDDGPASDPEKRLSQTVHKFIKKGLIASVKCDSCGEKILRKAWVCQSKLMFETNARNHVADRATACFCAVHKTCLNGPGVSKLCIQIKGIDSTKKRSSLNATLQSVEIEHIPNEIDVSFLEKTWSPSSKKEENLMLASAFASPLIPSSGSSPQLLRVDTPTSAESAQSSAAPDAPDSATETDSLASLGRHKSELRASNSSPTVVSGSVAVSFRKRFNSGSFVITTSPSNQRLSQSDWAESSMSSGEQFRPDSAK